MSLKLQAIPILNTYLQVQLHIPHAIMVETCLILTKNQSLLCLLQLLLFKLEEWVATGHAVHLDPTKKKELVSSSSQLHKWTNFFSSLKSYIIQLKKFSKNQKEEKLF